MSAASRLAPHATWLLVAASALAWGAAAGPHTYDAGELVAAACTLGGSHPPGQPLHALLGHVATWVPLGPIPWRVTLVSIAGVVVGAWCIGRLTGRLLEGAGSRNGVTRVAPDAAALCVLLAPPLLRQATRPEVYGVAFALTAAALLELTRWSLGSRTDLRPVTRAALLAGLTAAVNPPYAGTAVVAGGVIAALARRDAWRRPRYALVVPLAALLGVATYAYLPVRAAAGASMWGEPGTIQGLVDYVTARAYRMNLGADGQPWPARLADVGTYVGLAAGGIPLLGLGLLLVRRLASAPGARPTRYAVILMIPAAASVALMQPFEARNPDNVAYAAPAVGLLIAAGAAGLALGARSRRLALLSGAALALLALNLPSLPNALPTARARAPALETFGRALTDTPPPRTLVVVETDFVGATWMMARAVDGARPDVAVFATGLATSSWHWTQLASHPCYDGTPHAGPGATPRAQYVRGAMAQAANHVPIASEPDWPLDAQGTLAGAYLIRSAGHVPAAHPWWSDAAGERLAVHLDRETARLPVRPYDAEGAILRHYQLRRARRLAARGRIRIAASALARAAWWLPPAQQRTVRSVRAPLVRPRPPFVDDPTAFRTSRGEIVREAALLAWTAGSGEAALELLHAQLERGDPRSLLQLGWLHLAAGRPIGAREARDAFLDHAPELAPEARPLSSRLERASSSP